MIPITSPQTLGKVLRKNRKSLGFTQSYAGGKLNLTQKMVSDIESGKDGVHIATIFRYMAALGLEMQLEFRNKSLNESENW
jgi:HTH-type transcriptional regulator/antitoxin HipB